jgi:hypothetical protein
MEEYIMASNKSRKDYVIVQVTEVGNKDAFYPNLKDDYINAEVFEPFTISLEEYNKAKKLRTNSYRLQNGCMKGGCSVSGTGIYTGLNKHFYDVKIKKLPYYPFQHLDIFQQ